MKKLFHFGIGKNEDWGRFVFAKDRKVEGPADSVFSIDELKGIKKEALFPLKDALKSFKTEIEEQQIVDKIDNKKLVKNLSRVNKMSDYTSEITMSLQIALHKLGYDPGRIDGVYKTKEVDNSRTQKAVKAFQEAEGLTVDGLAGKNTLKSLCEKLNVENEKIVNKAVEAEEIKLEEKKLQKEEVKEIEGEQKAEEIKKPVIENINLNQQKKEQKRKEIQSVVSQLVDKEVNDENFSFELKGVEGLTFKPEDSFNQKIDWNDSKGAFWYLAEYKGQDIRIGIRLENPSINNLVLTFNDEAYEEIPATQFVQYIENYKKIIDKASKTIIKDVTKEETKLINKLAKLYRDELVDGKKNWQWVAEVIPNKEERMKFLNKTFLEYEGKEEEAPKGEVLRGLATKEKELEKETN